MKYFVYIIFSQKLNKFYTGFTQDIDTRVEQHNSGISTFTSKGIPWDLVHVFEVENLQIAKNLEQEIKGRGAKRFLQDKNLI